MAKQISKLQAPNYEDLLVFGYSCKLFRDDEKAIYVENGQHLIPWMGDSSLMVDRYDVRGALYDLEAAASYNRDGAMAELSEVELKEEQLCEQERYLALYHDLDTAAEREEEENKRLQVELGSVDGSFKQVGFSYNTDNPTASYPQQQQAYSRHQQWQQQQQPPPDAGAVQHPHSYTPQPDDDTFIPPPTLTLLPGMTVPTSIKQHKVIVKTAKFIAKQGNQMEIVLKTKQSSNPLFGFLSFDNVLNPYYKHMVNLIKTGKYTEDENSESNNNSEAAAEASFNPPDAAPGIKTPSKITKPTVPAPDCSYSKLISKIRENQAKNLPPVAVVPPPPPLVAQTAPVAATIKQPESFRSQSPLVETPVTTSLPLTTTNATATTTNATATTTAVTDGEDTSNNLTHTTGNATTTENSTAVALVTGTNSTDGAVAATPVASRLGLGATSTPVTNTNAVNKPFAGLVDYPSFNRTNDGDDYSNSDTDSDGSYEPALAPKTNGVSKGKPVKTSVKKKSSSANNVESKQKKSGSPIKNRLSDCYGDIDWPRPDEQMTIDKIACYTVKNGPKFEKTITARGDDRFEFLKSSHPHHKYYQLKLALYTEVFATALVKTKSKHSQRIRDVKAVVSDNSSKSKGSTVATANSKSWSSSSNATAVGTKPNAVHTISFSIKQRKDQEVTLPATSFPLESSSSEEDLDDLDEDERQRRIVEKGERRRWRKAKRDQFEKEKKEKKEREEHERMLKEEEEKRKLKELEEQENASGDEEMYDIFKYAQESGKNHHDSADGGFDHSKDVASRLAAAATAGDVPKDSKMRRKKAAHAFLSKLKNPIEEELPPQMIGPQLPPEMAAVMMMEISPEPSPPRAASPSSPPSLTTTPPLSSSLPPPLPRVAAAAAPATTPPPPPPAAETATMNDPDVLPLSSLLSTISDMEKKRPPRNKQSLLSAAVSSLLANEECAAIGLQSSKSEHARRRAERKLRRQKMKRSRESDSRSPSERSSRQRSTASTKKRKRKRSLSSSHRHHHHHKKHRHRSPSSHHHHHSSTSHRSKNLSSSKKKKSKSHSKRDKSKKKKSRRHRSVSVSSVTSMSSTSDSSRSRSRSRSSSSDSYLSLASSKRRKSQSGDEKSVSDVEVQVISDSDSSTRSSRSAASSIQSVAASSVQSVAASSVQSVAALPSQPPTILALATPTSSRASSTSRDTTAVVGELRRGALSSGTASPSPMLLLAPTPIIKPPLPIIFDMKNSVAVAKITEGLRAKVHALMDKKKPTN